LTPARAKLSAPDVVILIAGALLLIGSFLAFYTLPGYSVGTVKVGSQSANAWSRGLFGIATVAVVCGVAMAAQIALSLWATGVNLPPRPFGMRWDQVHLALGFQTAIMMLAFLAQNHGGLDLGIGFWMMLVSALVLFVAAIVRVNRRPNLRAS
jgi:hypothetical protein